MSCVHLAHCFNCDDHGPGFTVSGPTAVLTYDKDHLRVDGDLPEWSVASGYVSSAQAALRHGGNTELWEFLEFHYRDMLADA